MLLPEGSERTQIRLMLSVTQQLIRVVLWRESPKRRRNTFWELISEKPLTVINFYIWHRHDVQNLMLWTCCCITWQQIFFYSEGERTLFHGSLMSCAFSPLMALYFMCEVEIYVYNNQTVLYSPFAEGILYFIIRCSVLSWMPRIVYRANELSEGQMQSQGQL